MFGQRNFQNSVDLSEKSEAGWQDVQKLFPSKTPVCCGCSFVYVYLSIGHVLCFKSTRFLSFVLTKMSGCTLFDFAALEFPDGSHQFGF